MLIASASSSEGKMLVIGLDDENIRRLKNDEPIRKDLGEITSELEGWVLAIVGPEDMERFIAQVANPNG